MTGKRRGCGRFCPVSGWSPSTARCANLRSSSGRNTGCAFPTRSSGPAPAGSKRCWCPAIPGISRGRSRRPRSVLALNPDVRSADPVRRLHESAPGVRQSHRPRSAALRRDQRPARHHGGDRAGARGGHIEPVDALEELHGARRLRDGRGRRGVEQGRSLLAPELVHGFRPALPPGAPPGAARPARRTAPRRGSPRVRWCGPAPRGRSISPRRGAAPSRARRCVPSPPGSRCGFPRAPPG